MTEDSSVVAPKANGNIVSSYMIQNRYQFGIKIEEIGKGVIAIGVIDPSHARKKKLLDTSDNHVFVRMSDGGYYLGDLGWEGDGVERVEFGVGEKVYVEVDVEEGSIEWVFGKRKIRTVDRKLSSKILKWVPFVRMSEKS